MAKAVVIAIAVLAASLATSPVAAAGGQPPPNPSIAQYVEQVPTSGGSVVSAGHARVKLNKHVALLLPKGPEGAALQTVATSVAYGAPERKLHVPRKASKRVAAQAQRVVMNPTRDVSGATLSAAVDAVGAQRTLVVWLGFALLVTAGLGVGAAVARARR